jgi:hypothetical protein
MRRDRATWFGSCLSRRWRLLMRMSSLSCKAETCRARRGLVGGGSSNGELVGEAPNSMGTGRLASNGLDKGP